MRSLTLGSALLMLAVAASAAPDPQPNDAPDPDDAVIRISRGGRVRVSAPGVHVDVDAEKRRGVVEIETIDARFYADDSGKVDIRAPGVLIQVDPGSHP